jgi:thiol-disulfide isomerase/thioredoxin
MSGRYGVMFAALLALPLMAFGQVFNVTPSQPVVGETVTLIYNASAPGATLKGKTGLRGEAMLMFDTDMPVLVQFPLARTGDRWTGSFVLSDERARLVLFRVVAGQDQDNGDGNVQDIMVCDKTGKALRGANLLRGSLFAGGGVMEFRHSRDYAAAHAAFANEKSLYPDNWRVYPSEWGVMMRENRTEETREKIKAALDQYCQAFKGNEDALAAALNWFDQTGQKERADSLRQAAIQAAPTGKVAEAARRTAIFTENDMAKRAALIEKFIADFPLNAESKKEMLGLQINSLVAAKETEKALALLEKLPDANMFNEIAWGWIEKGENLQQAVQIAKKGVDLALNPPASSKPSYYSDEMWKQQSEFSAAMVLDTYGYGLFQQGKFADAEAAMQQAYGLTKGESPDITERLLTAYNKNGKYDKTLEVGKNAVEQGKTTDKLIEQYRLAYKAVNGTEKGLDALLAHARASNVKATKEKTLKGRLDKPAIPFTLKDLSGKSVSLAALKGKVVVIDFWATWCGPCKASFPTLQKISDRYKNNPSVKIFAVNTSERSTGKEREDLVKKFIADNSYRFAVLFDEGFADKYGVEGIPTKFVIDKKGKLAFKSVGFGGAEEMMTELTGQIDLLLEEK